MDQAHPICLGLWIQWYLMDITEAISGDDRWQEANPLSWEQGKYEDKIEYLVCLFYMSCTIRLLQVIDEIQDDTIKYFHISTPNELVDLSTEHQWMLTSKERMIAKH
jgi:hypothetical protein